MPPETPPTVNVVLPAKTWKDYAITLLPWLLFAITTALATWLGVQPPPPPEIVERVVERPVAASAESRVEYIESFGWHAPDDETVEANLDPARTLQFATTPAGRVAQGDVDVFLWQAVRKVNNRGPPWYPNVNQQSVGCCVGCGWKHCTDIVQATQILSGKRAEWKPTSVEVIYGESRVDVGGGRISGDGSVGAWARDAAAKFGVAPMQKYPTVDLSEFSPARAREYGRKGVPAEVKNVAKVHPIKGTALVKTYADVKRSIAQGYPIAVCSNQGFRMERDADGFCRPQGTWAHCMAIIGVRSGPREGAFILNSWGDSAHTGPVWPSDAPVAGFWADAKTVERMVAQNDSFALADIAGFPARRPDWFIAAPRPLNLFAYASRDAGYALAP